MGDSLNYKTRHLVALAKDGNASALGRLCAIYGDRVRQIVRLRMGNELRSKLQSMDVVQDAFIAALRGMKDFTYQNEGDFLRWLAAITENRIRDHLEKLHASRRDIRREIPLDTSRQGNKDTFVQTMGPVDATTPSMVVSKREELDRLEKAMDKLTPEYRQVILLAKMEGLSGAELAEKLGKSPGAARALLCRALAALSEAYGEPQ